ncbi:hypothetical protein SAMN05216188_104188 [Lentzea xinjiangensis]|uniref:Uncharacterized protein n=1 Tax=Lentzea xinjiangensis TaxID=402600 RepID=A0A1H9HSY3_9PSEU|nr:hypothetical protein [Lentzea xinjiangensis]SEQ65459.1 hypothetical protein SAMN05216188_104188 [Lentzea xinjiangensis]
MRILQAVAVIVVALLALAGVSAANPGCTPVGVWDGEVHLSDGPHPTRLEFRSGGVSYITNHQGTTTKGSWRPTGPDTFRFSFRGEKVYDENGDYFAYVDFDQDAVQSGPDNLTSSGPSSFYLEDGTLVGTSIIQFVVTRTS